MAEMINYGIDLGTTNSLIAKFYRGTVEVFKNPNGFKERCRQLLDSATIASLSAIRQKHTRNEIPSQSPPVLKGRWAQPRP
jgi:molecular chaperone DnaK (HSP70)